MTKLLDRITLVSFRCRLDSVRKRKPLATEECPAIFAAEIEEAPEGFHKGDEMTCAGSPGPSSQPLPPTPESLSILIIDDEIGPSSPVVVLLSVAGFRVTCAPTGAAGAAQAFACIWDLILLDLHLPDVLGMTLLSEFRRRELRVPVAIMTGWYLADAHDRFHSLSEQPHS
jgi:CheY-like chemotaxis protein